MIKTWDALTILNRATVLGIEISLAGEKLILESDNPIEPKVKEVVKAHKSILIAHLKKQQAEQQAELEAWLATQEVEPELCSTCFEQGLETPALNEPHEGLMYCGEHHPRHGAYKPMILDKIQTILGQCEIEEIPPYVDLEAYKAERMKQIVARERAKDRQSMIDNRRRGSHR